MSETTLPRLVSIRVKKGFDSTIDEILKENRIGSGFHFCLGIDEYETTIVLLVEDDGGSNSARIVVVPYDPRVFIVSE